MDQQDMQSEGGATLEAAPGYATDFLAGDIMRRFWSDDDDAATMAAKKKKKAPARKPAKKAPAKKPAKKTKKKPRPTRNRPGCQSGVSGCTVTRTNLP